MFVVNSNKCTNFLGMEGIAKKEIIAQLREKIMVMEGFKENMMEADQIDFGLDAMCSAFPRGIFPRGAVHEFVSPTAACATASNGFISGILSSLMMDGTHCLWVSTKRSLFPAALKFFGVPPHQVIFVDVRRDRDVLWVMEQGLKCDAFAAVVAELGEVTFAESQRLQLAVEKSGVTGFLHRRRPQRQHALACMARWKIRPSASHLPDDLPGVGHPVWEVQLEKIKNGKPGNWRFGWRRGKFVCMPAQQPSAKPGLQKMERYG